MRLVRLGVLGFAIAVNAAAIYALHVAMGEGTERARLAIIEPPQVIVSAPKDGPAFASTQIFVP